MDYFCSHCQDRGKEADEAWCSVCGGFTSQDYQDFHREVVEEMVVLGKSEVEAEKLLGEKLTFSQGKTNRWLLFHESPEHWAKMLVLGRGYWRKDVGHVNS